MRTIIKHKKGNSTEKVNIIQLQKISKKAQNIDFNLSRKRKRTKKSCSSKRAKNDLFEVEKILDERINNNNNESEFLIKWKGYTAEENSWEPLRNLGKCQYLLEDFQRRNEEMNQKKPIIKKANIIKKERSVEFHKKNGVASNKLSFQSKKMKINYTVISKEILQKLSMVKKWRINKKLVLFRATNLFKRKSHIIDINNLL